LGRALSVRGRPAIFSEGALLSPDRRRRARLAGVFLGPGRIAVVKATPAEMMTSSMFERDLK